MGDIKKPIAKAKEDVAEARKNVKKNVERVKQSVEAKRAALRQNTVTQNRLKLLITTVARNKADYYTDLIQSFEVNMQMTVLAEGTADAGMLATLGLTESSKAVIFSVIQEDLLPDALAALEEKFSTIKGGKGIAFTVPLTSVIGTLIFGFLSNNEAAVKENRK